MADAQLDRKGVVTTCPSCGQRNRIAYRAAARRDPLRQMPTRPSTRRASRSRRPTRATFDAAIAQSDLPVVVDFWAPWCGPCRMVAPELAKVAAAHAGEYLILKVNTDAIPELGERFQIRSIPTMAVFAGRPRSGPDVRRPPGRRHRGIYRIDARSPIS